MDKYEFNIKVEQIKKLVNKGDFETAMKIADTIDWRRVRSTSLLTMISQIYEKNAEYQDAKDILLLAYERAPLGKGLLYKLTDLALRENNIQEAEAYYREFCELSGDDPRQYLLRFLILEAKDAPLEQQINSLERYCQEELDEKWLYHLAELYHQANQADDCVRICDKIMLMFGLGKYVDKAMELKLQYAPLTKYQMDLVENREKYEEKLRAVEEEYKNGTYRKPEPEGEYLDTDEPEAELDDEPENEPEGQPEQAEPEEKAGKPKAETKPADEKVEKAALDENVVASLHEAQAEEALAKEVSKIKPYDEEEGASRLLAPAQLQLLYSSLHVMPDGAPAALLLTEECTRTVYAVQLLPPFVWEDPLPPLPDAPAALSLTLTMRDVEEIDACPAALGHRLACDKAGKRWLHHPRAETYLSERTALFQRLYR